MVSAAASGILLVLGAVALRSPPAPLARSALAVEGGAHRGGGLLLLGALAFAFKALYLDNHDTPLKYGFNGERVRSAQVSVQIDFGNRVSLLGYDLSADLLHPGDTLGVTLYWRAREGLDSDYQSFVHLIDRGLNIYAQKDHVHPGPSYPSSRWDLDEYNRDTFQVAIPKTLPAGSYLLEVGLYGGGEGQNLPVVSDGGFRVWQPSAILQGISVGEVPPSLPGEAQSLTDANFGELITLLGYGLDSRAVAPGDTLRLALYWRGDQTPDRTYSSFVHLTDATRRIYAQHDNLFVGALYPTTRWRQGEVQLEVHEISVPVDIPPGQYTLGVGLYDPRSAERLPLVPDGGEGGFLALLRVSVSPGRDAR